MLPSSLLQKARWSPSFGRVCHEPSRTEIVPEAVSHAVRVHNATVRCFFQQMEQKLGKILCSNKVAPRIVLQAIIGELSLGRAHVSHVEEYLTLIVVLGLG